MNRHGIWIWENTSPKKDEYADFIDTFTCEDCEDVSLRISADSNYAVYVNGALAAFGQYADFPHCKVADTHDLTKYCKAGENKIAITVWYYGAGTSTYFVGEAGLFYEITAGEKMLACSTEDTLCRLSPYYVSWQEKWITKEIGCTWYYNAAGKESAYRKAIPTGYAPELHERPILTLDLLDRVDGKIVGGDGKCKYILDLGCEEVGFPDFSFESDCEQKITISWGEHLVNGEVPSKIGPRIFIAEYGAKIGENTYINPFRRFGCRYLCFQAEQPIRLNYAGIRPTMYPVTEIPFDAGDERRQKIYDISVRTLRLCMHEHYEDCPWREQSLYTMDSRNQMLCGYYAFGETRFPRASLWLFAQDEREDGILSDCAPSSLGFAIPSFALHWYRQIREYTEHSGDTSLVKEIWEKMCDVLEFFVRLTDKERCLLHCPPDNKYWNFHEWAGAELRGSAFTGRDEGRYDLLLNCLFLYALDVMTEFSDKLSLPFAHKDLAAPLRASIRKTFRREDGLYNTYESFEKIPHVCELGLAYAILTGVADEADAEVICRVLTNTERDLHIARMPLTDLIHTEVASLIDVSNGTIPVVGVSLSMTTFVYDALLMTDAEKYKDFVLSDIDARYGMMVDEGATSFWETMTGWKGFGTAGSMCHGWSTLAVYYYHKLLK